MARTVDRERRVDRVILGAWILAISLSSAGRVSDTDPYWQIRAGQEVLAGSPLVRPDAWSWAPNGGMFYPNSPAWNVVLAAAWQVADSWGLFVVSACSVGVCLSLIAYLAVRLGARSLPTVPVVLLASGLALPILSPRPALASESILLGAIAAAEWWSRRAALHGLALNTVVALGMSAGFSLTGNWVHLSWASLAAVAAVSWAVVWLTGSGITSVTRAVLIAVGTLGFALGSLLGPYGPGGWERASLVLSVCQGIVIEWMGAFTAELGGRWWPSGLAVSAVAFASAAWCTRTIRRHGRGDRRLVLVSALTACGLPFALGGFVAIRFIPLAVLTLAPVAAAAFTSAMLSTAQLVRTQTVPSRRLAGRAAEWTTLAYWRVVLTAALIALTPLVAIAAWPHAEPETAALNRLLPTGCRLFGTSVEAAAVVLTRPDVKVWLDGRSEYWGRQRLIQSGNYLFHPSADRLVPQGTTCVLLTDSALEPGLTELTRMLDASPDWQHVPAQGSANLWIPAERSPASLS